MNKNLNLYKYLPNFIKHKSKVFKIFTQLERLIRDYFVSSPHNKMPTTLIAKNINEFYPEND